VGPGENFQGEIARAIRDSGLMILIFSANANRSAEINKEIALAGQNRLVVIPVRIEDVVPSEELSYEFATRQWIDLFDNWERSIQQLLAQIAKIVPPETATARDSAVIAANAKTKIPQVAPAATRSWLYGIGAVALIAIAGAGLYWTGLISKAPTAVSAPNAASGGAGDKPAGNDEMLRGAAAYDRNDYAQAMEYFQKAADKGNSGGAYDIGWLYENGFGVPRDYHQAMRWYLKAAAQNNAKAENSIATFYADGIGVQRNIGIAIQWLQKAAADGYGDASANIARLKKTGQL
jgi:tetratricopeptide (TPR) repeat protein